MCTVKKVFLFQTLFILSLILYKGSEANDKVNIDEELPSVVVINSKVVKRDFSNFRAQLRPYIYNGELAGITLLDIQNGSVFMAMKLKNHDIIQAIDGKPITTIEDSFELYNVIQSKSKFSLIIRRKLSNKTVNYVFE